MLRQHVWKEDNDVLDHIIKNSQKEIKLRAQYENHLYAEKFTKECSVVFIYKTYVLKGEADANFSLSETWNLLQDAADPLPNESDFCMQLINL